MDFYPGETVTATPGSDIFDSTGMLAGVIDGSEVGQIAGARKLIVSPDPRRRGEWFWGYPAYLGAEAAASGKPFWLREQDLQLYAPSITSGGSRVGALSDLTPFGMMVPPLGLYEITRSSKPGGQGAAAAERQHGPGRSEGEHGLHVAWSTIASLTIVAGGALAVYLIYVASKKAIPINERAGRAAGRIFGARYGLTGSGAPSRVSHGAPRQTWLPPSPAPRPRPLPATSPEESHHPLLGAYEAYAPATEV